MGRYAKANDTEAEELKFFGLAYKFDMKRMREEAAKCISFGLLDGSERI